MEMIINKDGKLEEYKEPYLTLEFPTKEDWEEFKKKYKIEEWYTTRALIGSFLYINLKK